MTHEAKQCANDRRGRDNSIGSDLATQHFAARGGPYSTQMRVRASLSAASRCLTSAVTWFEKDSRPLFVDIGDGRGKQRRAIQLG